MKTITVLLTPGGGPGILAQLASLKGSKKYQARAVMADANPASGNLYLPDVDARYILPICSAPEYPDALMRLINKEGVEVLYSGLDEELPLLAGLQPSLQAAGCSMLIPPQAALLTALDKEDSHHKLLDVVRLPDSIFLDDPGADPEAFYHKHRGQVLIKVTNSRGGRHIYIPEDEEEFLFFLGRVRRIRREQGLAFMIQQLIQGREYNVSLLHDMDRDLVYAVSRRKFESRLVKSTTTAAAIHRRDDVIEQAVAAANALDLIPGFNNVETIVSDEDDLPYFIEINGGRTAAQDMNLVAAGVNLTDLLIDIVRGEKPAPIPHPKDGGAILKIRKDVLVNIEDVEKAPRI